MYTDTHKLNDLVNDLKQFNDDQLLSANTGVSEVIIRRIRTGKETSVRSMTMFRLNKAIKQLSQ